MKLKMEMELEAAELLLWLPFTDSAAADDRLKLFFGFASQRFVSGTLSQLCRCCLCCCCCRLALK